MSYGGYRVQVQCTREALKTWKREMIIERIFEPAIAALLRGVEKFPEDDTEVFISITAQGLNDLDRAILADAAGGTNDES